MTDTAPRRTANLSKSETTTPDPLAASAAVAAARQDWREALDAWTACASRTGPTQQSRLGQAEARRGLFQLDEADAALACYATPDGTLTPDATAEIAVSRALTAQLSGDWPQALQRWHIARTRFPEAPATWAGEAALLQVLGRSNKANELTGLATEKFPTSIDIASQHCNVALWLKDWLAADLRLAAMERLFPDHPYAQATVPRIRTDIDRGLASEDTASLHAIAATAEAAQAWPFASDIHRRLLHRLPGDPNQASRLAHALHQGGNADAADSVLEAAMRTFPDAIEIRTRHARLATDRQDWPEAARRWQETLRRFSLDSPETLAAAIACRDAGLTDLAEKILQPLLDLEPQNADLHGHHAMIADCAGDRTAARKRWDHVHRLRAEPNAGDITAVAQRCNAALNASDWPEADRQLAELQSQFTHHPYTAAVAPRHREAIDRGLAAANPTTLRAFAANADAARQWQFSARLWRLLQERHPSDPACVIGLAEALQAGDDHDEADRILTQAIETIPGQLELHTRHARSATTRQVPQEAAKRWQETLRRFPDARAEWITAAVAYRDAGLTDRARALLDQALAFEPDRAELHIQQAVNAERAGLWPEAVAHWNDAHRLHPDDPNIRNSRGDAIWQQSISRLETGVAEDQRQAEIADTDTTAKVKRLALRFEGLGDNCEFGIVQRRFGADPLGLFRFAAINAANLTRMIAEHLEPLGDTGCTRLDVTSGGEYLIQDTRGFYLMHSFVQKHTVEPDKFLRQQLSRIGFLKRKLLEDLRDGEKIFVYKASYGISDDEITAMAEAIALHGNNTLLVVRKATAAETPGTIHPRTDQILIGTVATLYDTDTSPIDYTSWRMLLEATARLRDGTRS